MVIVLKLIALAMSRQDACKSKELNPYQAQHKVEHLPNLIEYLGYAFCCGNLLAGPFVEYHEYMDCVEEKGHWALQRTRSTGYVQYGLRKVGESLLSMVAMLYMEPRYGVTMLSKPWFQEQALLTRLLLHWVCGVVSQLRYSFVWLLSEASLTFMGLNLKGWDEKERPIWGLCANCNFVGVQLSESARALPQNWNTCTGRFLRRYVYDRLTPAGKRAGFPQLLATQLISGVWHGLYPGYLLFFASSALMFQASTGIARVEALTLPDKVVRSPPVRLIHIIITGIMLNHLALSFVLLDFQRGIGVFRDVHFMPHIFMTVMTLAALTLPDVRRSKPQGRDASKEQKAQAPAGKVE
ncbi:MBOAT, membrane-bound O-acyltransferase family-domain-containing protein [Dunaliella salina]|uniref:MBOAT, membrane-bound O-acyltransferase family-domain-containing protein n=1 Tax=Dunaliella salina TaxID=3046 RepID=A0ABQ7FWX8_DUNSA|nr:MBOAT, membrane-bound O-acyltransferase family-domain-containing protein [Dunaliella salina]|eukprot:KAF5826856.1 MBOAT, membrane-bound O-acyltransferase family-domain-containing protein [Dunaliella salina]